MFEKWINKRPKLEKSITDEIQDMFKYTKGDKVIYHFRDANDPIGIKVKCIVEKADLNLQGIIEYILINKDYSPGPYKFLAYEDELSPFKITKYNRKKLKL